LRRSRLADRWTDLFDVTEFIAPDGLFKTTNAEAPKKQRLFSQVPQRRLGVGRKF